MKHHETSWNIMKHHETSWNIMKHRETSWNIVKHRETLWNIIKPKCAFGNFGKAKVLAPMVQSCSLQFRCQPSSPAKCCAEWIQQPKKGQRPGTEKGYVGYVGYVAREGCTWLNHLNLIFSLKKSAEWWQRHTNQSQVRSSLVRIAANCARSTRPTRRRIKLRLPFIRLWQNATWNTLRRRGVFFAFPHSFKCLYCLKFTCVDTCYPVRFSSKKTFYRLSDFKETDFLLLEAPQPPKLLKLDWLLMVSAWRLQARLH